MHWNKSGYLLRDASPVAKKLTRFYIIFYGNTYVGAARTGHTHYSGWISPAGFSG